MSLDSMSEIMLPKIEDELKRAVSLTDSEGYGELYNMLAYHLGWIGAG